MRLPSLAAALLLSGLASAQAQGTPPPASSGSPAASGQPAATADTLRPTFVAQTPEDMVATRLIGTSVTNAAGDTIGQIADIVLDQKGQVKAWIIGVGGFLGIGSKFVAVDPGALTLSRADKALKASIDTTRDQLKAAPEYVYLGQQPPKGAAPAPGPAGEPAAKP